MGDEFIDVPRGSSCLREHYSPRMGNLRVAFIVIALALIAANAVAQTKKNVVFLGDSLTAGYGVDPDDAFPALIEKKNAKEHLPYHFENAGGSGGTNPRRLRPI